MQKDNYFQYKNCGPAPSIHEYDYPALCIPRALGTITPDELYKIMNNSGLGEISKIVIKPKEFVLPKWERTAANTNGNGNDATVSETRDHERQQKVCYNNIYIYFKKWNTHDPRVCKYRDNVIKGQSIKIVHKSIPTPIFWRCVAANFTLYRNKINNTNI
jgi:hypothetical protein